MKEIKVLEGKVVAPEGMKVGIVASRFNEIIVNKLLGGAIDGLVRHGVEEENITAAWVPGAFEIPVAASAMAKGIPHTTIMCAVRSPRESRRWDWQRRCRYSSAS